MPDPDRLSALSNFPTPTDQPSVWLFLGLCNQLAYFVPDFQHHTESLRQLPVGFPNARWSLTNSKQSLLAAWSFGTSDSSKPVYLLTNASRLFGLGYVLGHIELDSSGQQVFK